ncbi:alanine racemase domain-containing protein [Cordyceps javanica]|uniref:Alanine racemase domain-containing protein n=1 Tax=Cordyceps javanica TaxID=43265 RepID=A0A545V869_9HYPO|nr:alanine racemase domain-containing protein [Cordyceps javanica]TQW08925.1 alanine racemase domain protein [Cordyceps javanica]
MSSLTYYPASPRKELIAEYVGKSIRDVPTPAAIINVAAVRRNCSRMLEACKSLKLGWRAHVKTHKTVEITRLQVGDDAAFPVNIVISTLAEGEFLLQALKEYKSQGRQVNVLYGLPITANAVDRLAAIASALGEGSVSILLDDPAQLPVAAKLRQASGVAPHASIKIDMGGKRAGVAADSDRLLEVAGAALSAHRNGDIVLAGLYSHAGQSYGGDSRAAAIKMMGAEITAMMVGADRIKAQAAEQGVSSLPALILSGGASPTALSVQNLLSQHDDDDDAQAASSPELQAEVQSLTTLFGAVKSSGHVVEIHAGVYPTLDLQQLAAHSMSASRLSWGDIALTVLAEVHGTYPGRGENGTPEALVGAGGLALGREFCKAYDGMAMVTPWGRPGASPPAGDVEDYEGWTVGRFSQEHGILTWAAGKRRASSKTAAALGPPSDMVEVGQKVKLWPNHACITSSHFGWYFVVDEDQPGKEDEIVDIWTKARGW